MPFDSFLPPRHQAHSANARTFLLVGRYEDLHPVVASPLLEVSSVTTSRLTARWPIISMPQPEGPDIAVSVEYFGPFTVTLRRNRYILLFADRFNRQADMFTITTPDFTLRALLAVSSTGTFPPGDARAAYSLTTASCFFQRVHMPSTRFFVFGKFPPPPSTRMAMVEWSV